MMVILQTNKGIKDLYQPLHHSLSIDSENIKGFLHRIAYMTGAVDKGMVI
jgi:hypothetical protein